MGTGLAVTPLELEGLAVLQAACWELELARKWWHQRSQQDREDLSSWKGTIK